MQIIYKTQGEAHWGGLGQYVRVDKAFVSVLLYKVFLFAPQPTEE